MTLAATGLFLAQTTANNPTAKPFRPRRRLMYPRNPLLDETEVRSPSLRLRADRAEAAPICRSLFQRLMT